MIIGLIGASRTGKTTIAEAIADDFDFTFHPTSITKSAKKVKLDPVAPMTLQQRVMLQQSLLLDFVEQVSKYKGPIIVDRTPIDMAAYLLGEFHMQSHVGVDPAVHQQVVEYVNSCIAVMNSRFLGAMICTPLPVYVQEEGKPAFNPAYQMHSQILMEGLATRVDKVCKIVRFNTDDFDDRMDQAHTFISTLLRNAEQNRIANPNVH